MKVMDVIKIQNFINNSFIPTEKTIESFTPMNGELNAIIPDSGKPEADQAVEAAFQAFKTWSATSVSERAAYLNKIADEIELRLEEFAKAESIDQGKPLFLSQNIEIPRAIQNFRYFASAILVHKNESTESIQTHTINYTCETPAGVSVLISPWNLPLYLLTWKIAPCIAAGCTCVCKPSEFTSVTAFKLCQVIQKIGLPPGVVNVVFGYGSTIGNELVSHPEVNLISFTGGTVTGSIIKKATASHSRKKLSLELGGKNPGIVFEDADLDKFMKDIGRACFQNSGQICLCSSRFFVHASIVEEFLTKLVAYARELVVGNPLKQNTRMGPVVSKQHYDKVKSYIEMAANAPDSCRILCGETIDPRPSDCDPNGYYILPTVIRNIDDSTPLVREEIFGPVVCVTTFHDEEEAIERANDTKYGLAATIWTQNLGKAHRVARSLECGYVWINSFLIRDLSMPFGGIKESGTGREGYPYSFDFFTEKKTVCVHYG